MSTNKVTLAIFAPLLLVIGVLGFVIPAESSLTSGTAPYNIFHLAFGVIGVLVFLTRNDVAASAFNLVFGLLDLYQFLASKADLFPEWYFQWKAADDILHVVIGAFLVLVGVYGLLTNRPVPVKDRKARPLLH
jgi:hypothetical protein